MLYIDTSKGTNNYGTKILNRQKTWSKNTGEQSVQPFTLKTLSKLKNTGEQLKIICGAYYTWKWSCNLFQVRWNL